MHRYVEYAINNNLKYECFDADDNVIELTDIYECKFKYLDLIIISNNGDEEICEIWNDNSYYILSGDCTETTNMINELEDKFGYDIVIMDKITVLDCKLYPRLTEIGDVGLVFGSDRESYNEQLRERINISPGLITTIYFRYPRNEYYRWSSCGYRDFRDHDDGLCGDISNGVINVLSEYYFAYPSQKLIAFGTNVNKIDKLMVMHFYGFDGDLTKISELNNPNIVAILFRSKSELDINVDILIQQLTRLRIIYNNHDLIYSVDDAPDLASSIRNLFNSFSCIKSAN